MNKLPFFILLTLFLYPGLTTRAQWPAFGVYHTAGTIKCKSAHESQLQPVAPHSWLYDGDKLMLLDNISEIILFDRDTNYIRLHGKGTYSTADIRKMQKTHVRDNITVRYLSMVWEELLKPGSGSLMEKEKIAHSTGGVSRGLSPILNPRDDYSTSMDLLCFRWHSIHWAHKYFLRLRDRQGQLLYDTITADTQAVVHFPGRIAYGNTYTWSLDLIGESGRLQFADSSSLTLIDESTALTHFPAFTSDMDSLGGIATLLQRIRQYEDIGCTRMADTLFHRLTNDYPQDLALNQLYIDFRRRNYLE
jgi:hypothetical protein